ncbi:MAG: M1 family metallopeptidase [Cyclobacteriaceae bacterium]|nr:M1 family metallopeptidase [Cyclobacteriaceae bacterium]MCH8516182.1 M1 family metallopeptidase [Cyclobacteriaceae bacterium]
MRNTFAALLLLSSLLTSSCKPSETSVSSPEAKSSSLDNDSRNNMAFDDASDLWTSDDNDWLFIQEKELPKFRKSPTRAFNLIHTQLKVSFDWDEQTVKGLAVIDLTPHFYPQQILEINAKSFDIKSIKMIRPDTTFILTYDYDQQLISIQLDKEYVRGDTMQISIDYLAHPQKCGSGGGNAITDDKGVYFINPDGSDPNIPTHLWTQGQTEGSSCWFPTIDHPNQKHTQEIYIQRPKNMQSLSNGVLASSREISDDIVEDYWKMDQPHAPYLTMMAVGEFAVHREQWRGKEISYWVEPEFAEHAPYVFGNTPKMLDFFSDLLDYEYPWPKYAQIVVRDFVSGAMENTSASVFYDRLLVDKRTLIDENHDDIIAHELFHHWFGNITTAESWSQLALNEAFANYSEYLWKEHNKGKEEADFHLHEEWQQYLYESQTKTVDLIRFEYEAHDDMFDSHSYAKGGVILHMLREKLGDDAFFSSLSHFLKKHEFKSVEAHDLRLAFEEVTGLDLYEYFDQWFYASGHPELAIRYELPDSTENLQIIIMQTQNLEDYPLYELPLNFSIFLTGDDKEYRYSRALRSSSYTFTISDLPSYDVETIIFDHDFKVFGDHDIEMSEKFWYHQYLRSTHNIRRLEAFEMIVEAEDSPYLDDILEKALEDSFYEIRRLAVEAIYEKDLEEEYHEQLERLSREDPRSQVRAEALQAVIADFSEDYGALLDQALVDTSLMVQNIAVSLYYEFDPIKGKQILEEKEKEDHPSFMLTLARYFIDEEKQAKSEWYIAGLRRGDFMDKFYMYQLAGEYAETIGGDRGIFDILFEHAKNASSKYHRFSAFQGMLALVSIYPDEVSVRIAEVVDNEEDDELISFYRSIFVE